MKLQKKGLLVCIRNKRVGHYFKMLILTFKKSKLLNAVLNVNQKGRKFLLLNTASINDYYLKILINFYYKNQSKIPESIDLFEFESSFSSPYAAREKSRWSNYYIGIISETVSQ